VVAGCRAVCIVTLYTAGLDGGDGGAVWVVALLTAGFGGISAASNLPAAGVSRPGPPFVLLLVLPLQTAEVEAEPVPPMGQVTKVRCWPETAWASPGGGSSGLGWPPSYAGWPRWCRPCAHMQASPGQSRRSR